ncbi:MAG: cobalamin B12-binding domain-containing protein, partial [Candidatus Nanoarchaeia archaeon]|nr:cobalamin B12-binding domain-containing protein [Candidatus Nanoarchaeia archaeon]
MLSKKDLKIMLIAPRTTSFGKNAIVKCMPPLGIAYIAAVLEKDGFDVKILDATVEGYEHKEVDGEYLTYGLPLEDIKKRIEEYKPGIVGVNFSFSPQRKNVYDIFKIVKEVSKDIITVVGGPHPTYLPERVLKNEDIDYVFLGESEYSMREF